jgi:hypothetical protein
VKASSSARGGLQLPIRRRRGPAVMVEPEELRTPASFTVARDGTPLAVEVPVVTVKSPVDARAPSPAPPLSVKSSHRSESPSRRVSSPSTAPGPQLERRSTTIRLGAFNGTNVPLETHLAKLRNCAAYYGWSETDRVCHLKASLEGNAASLLWELPVDCSEQLLLDRLQSRFGDREQIERFRFELKTRRRRKGESIQALHQDVCRLLALSYPGETGSLSKIVARDAFLDSLGDPEMRIRILEKGAASIEEAFSIAARYESYLAGSADLVSPEEGGRRRVRAVNSQPDGAASDVSWRRQMEQSVSDLKDGIARLLQQQSCPPQAVGQSSPASSVLPPVASGGQSSSPGRRPPPRGAIGRCFTCGAVGHLARSCPNAKSSVDSPASLREIQAGDDRTEVYLSAELHKGGKVLHVDITLDTGSVHSVLPAKWACDSWLRPTGVKLVAANGTNISVCGRACVKFTVGDVKLSAEVLVSDSVDEFLLGLNWLRENSCLWNFATSTIAICGREVKLKSRRPLCNVRRVIASDNVVVEGRSSVYVPVRLAFASLHTKRSNWIVEPRVVGDKLLLARGLFDDAEHAVVRLSNPTSESVAVRRGLCLGDAEPVQFNCDVCGDVCFCVPEVDCATSAKTRVVTSRPAVSTTGSAAGADVTIESGANAGTAVLNDDQIVLPMLSTLPDCVNADKRAEIEAVLRRNVNLFARHEYDVGGTDLVQYKLELRDPSARPVCEPLRRHPTAHLDLIDAEVDKLLNAGLIVPCNSPWASNVVLVKRRSAPGLPPRLRITCDFRLLNMRLHRLGFPMPSSQLIFDSLQGHRHFTVLDFSNAYLSVKLHPETSHLTAFVTRRGMFKFLRLGAGLSSAPAIFNQLVQILFSDMLWCEVLAFLDDLTLPSRSVDEGIKLLAKVFDRLQGAGLKLKASKCKLLQTEVKVLGVIVSQGSLREDPERAAVINLLTFPRTKRELRSLLGFVNFSRAHHKNLSEIMLPLTACLKKGGKVEETPQTLQAFRRLQEIMSSPPVLAMFDPSAKLRWIVMHRTMLVELVFCKQVLMAPSELLLTCQRRLVTPSAGIVRREKSCWRLYLL